MEKKWKGYDTVTNPKGVPFQSMVIKNSFWDVTFTQDQMLFK